MTLMVAASPAPVAVDDTYTVPVNAIVDAATGVLANDTGWNNGSPVAALAFGPSHGTLTLNADGSFAYTPDDDFTGTDTFGYRPTDDDGPGALATVQIHVTDHTPDAENDTAYVSEDGSVLMNVLANDTDPDGDDLAIVGVGSGLFGERSWLVQGVDMFTNIAA